MLEKIKQLKLRNKMLIGIGLIVVILMVGIGGFIINQITDFGSHNIQNLDKELLEEEKAKIKNAVEITSYQLSQVYDRNKDNMSKTELKKLIKDQTEDLSFGQAGYIFIYNNQGTFIAHGAEPSLAGKDFWNEKDLHGKYFMRELVKKAEAGGGFVEYYWENPNTNKEETKISYVKHIKETDWNVATGIYDSITAAKLKEAKANVIQFKNQITKTILIIFAAAILILGFIIIKISGYITNNISEILKGVKRLADGDLQDKVRISSKDELGDLAEHYNKTIEQLSNLITKLVSNIENLSAYSEELSANAQEGNATIETTNELIESMSANIQQISASAEEVTSFAQESNSKTEIGSENIDDTLSSMNKINNSVNKAVTTINKLDDTSQEIGEIVEIITNIAEQTNLLALNAAIEAARAGDAGQGFAVVAEEIRGLAEETNNATKEIANLIEQTQDQTNNGLEAVKEVKQRVVKGEEVVEKTGEVFEEIQQASNQTASQIQQTASATQQLAENSDEVKSATGDIQGMSNEIAASSQELTEMAQELQELIDKFKV